MHFVKIRETITCPDLLFDILKIFLTLKGAFQIHGIKRKYLRIINSLLLIFDHMSTAETPSESLSKIHGTIRKGSDLIPCGSRVCNAKHSQHDRPRPFPAVLIDIIKFYFFSESGKLHVQCILKHLISKSPGHSNNIHIFHPVPSG